MGKKNKKGGKRRNKNEDFAEEENIKDFAFIQNGVKNKSKLARKWKKNMQKIQDRNMQTKLHKPEEIDRCGFHKVSVYVKNGIQIDKLFLLSSIRNYIDEPFCALGFFRIDDTMNFYFEANKNIAESIRSLDKKIQCPNGELIGLKVEFVNETDFILNCEQTELLNCVVLNRFDRSNGLLNLSSFHLDPRFIETNTFVPLSNKRILRQVFFCIKELMPEVHAFDLSNNKLSDGCLELLNMLDLRSHSLTAFNLENNNLKSLKCLNNLKVFPLKELKIIGNNFRNEKPSTKSYTRAVMKAVPSLKILDGIDLNEARQSGSKGNLIHDNSSTNSLQNVIINASITEEIVKSFFYKYYSLFDAADREKLREAYLPSAKIELYFQNPMIPDKTFEGQAAIQEFLKSFPQTKHEPSSLSLEMLKLSPEEGISQIQGLCAFSEPQMAIHQFKRIMKIVPFNGGFCCAADMLCIS